MDVDFSEVRIIKKRESGFWFGYRYFIQVKAPVLIFFYKWVTIYTFYKYPSDILTDTFAKELIHTISKL